jgi:hypothetical protein
MRYMSRLRPAPSGTGLRRLVLSDRFFFITCRVHALRRTLNESEFACLAEVIAEQASEEFVHFQTLRPLLRITKHSDDGFCSGAL